jgi:hypothetical protein
LLTLLRLSAGGDVDQRLAERDRKRNGESRLRDPDVFNEIEALDLLGYLCVPKTLSGFIE